MARFKHQQLVVNVTPLVRPDETGGMTSATIRPNTEGTVLKVSEGIFNQPLYLVMFGDVLVDCWEHMLAPKSEP